MYHNRAPGRSPSDLSLEHLFQQFLDGRSSPPQVESKIGFVFFYHLIVYNLYFHISDLMDVRFE